MGQGDVVVSPLQLARAFAGLLHGGQLPALHIVDAVEDPAGGWRAQPPGEPESFAVSEPTAQAMVDLLRQGDRIAFAAEAVPGMPGGNTAWFLGAELNGGDDCVVVLVLEDSFWQDAMDLGTALLRSGQICAAN